MGAIALCLLVLDQLTKWLVIHRLHLGDEVRVLPGFFNLVHWGNTGAAWSLFHGNNQALATVSAVALLVLYWARSYFEGDTVPGQIALGLIFGGIVGNLIDRMVHQHVIDFLYFHVYRRDGEVLGFPAFNLADTAICTGVGVVFLLSWLPHRRRLDEPGSGTELESAPLTVPMAVSVPVREPDLPGLGSAKPAPAHAPSPAATRRREGR